MRSIELFAGAGFAARGLHAAGCSPLALIERDRSAAASLALNFPDAPIVCADVADVNLCSYTGRVDLLWASPPCQPYSKAGSRRGAADRRDGWPLVLAAVAACRPTWVVVENVPGCPAAAWINDLKRAGYPWSGSATIDAADHGVPQHRKRVFVIAGPHGLRWPDPTHCEQPQQTTFWGAQRQRWSACGDAIGGPVYMFATHPEGAASVTARRVRDLTRRPCVCIGVYKGKNLAGQPWTTANGQRRDLTVQELLILQGAADHQLSGSISSKRRQIGNAVAPVVSMRIAAALQRAVS